LLFSSQGMSLGGGFPDTEDLLSGTAHARSGKDERGG